MTFIKWIRATLWKRVLNVVNEFNIFVPQKKVIHVWNDKRLKKKKISGYSNPLKGISHYDCESSHTQSNYESVFGASRQDGQESEEILIHPNVLMPLV